MRMSSVFAARIVALGLAAVGCGLAQGPAAGSSFGVYASANGGSQGCGASWTYDTNTGGSGSVSNTPGNNSISNCSGSARGPKQTGLVTATSHSSQQADMCGGTVSSSDNAGADLTMGTVRNYATTSGCDPYNPVTETDLWDFLTFSVPGATDSTVTPIKLTLNLAGTYNDPTGYSSAHANLQVGPTPVCQCTHGNDVTWGVNASDVAPGAGNFGYFIENSSFVTWGMPTYSITGIAIQGTANLVGANPTLSFALQLLTEANFPVNLPSPSTSTLNFPGTGGVLYLTLPPGVTYTSTSGKFLSGTQPAVLSFSSFTAKLSATTGSAGSFHLNSTFTLGASAPTFDPASQPVVLQVGPYTVAIPSKYFHLLKSGANAGDWRYQGTINGVALTILIAPQGGSTYKLTASGSPVDFTSLTNPAPVSIAVGGNGGNTLQVTF